MVIGLIGERGNEKNLLQKMKKTTNLKNSVEFDIAKGVEHTGYKEYSIPIERVIRICDETATENKNTKKPRFQECQVTVEGMRLYLRTNRAMPDRSIKARILTLPGRRKFQDVTLISVDDLTDIKSSIQENRSGNSKKHVSIPAYLKRYKWWLCAMMIAVGRAYIYIQGMQSSFTAASVFNLYPYMMMPLLVILLWGCVQVFQNLLGFGGRAKSDDRTDNNGKKKKATQLFGQYVIKTSEPTSLVFQLPKIDRGLLFDLELREGKVEQVQYSYLVRENDGTDCSVIECVFQLIDASNRIVHCRYEVGKHSALLFLQEGDVVRVVAKCTDHEMQVSYALNRSDGHTYGASPIWNHSKKLNRRNNLWSFSLQAMYNATEMLIVGTFMACLFMILLVSFVFVPLLMFLDLTKSPVIWRGLTEMGELSEPVKIVLMIFGVIWLYVVYRTLKQVLEWSLVQKMLGLGSVSELLSRVRVVCNEDIVPLDAFFSGQSICLNPQGLKGGRVE